MQENLVFLISTPRAGSTLLMRILHATSQIYSRPEPHILPALAHLGYWRTVDKAPYDQLQAQQAIQDFVSSQSNGEEIYLDACRAYTDKLYTAMLEEGEGKYFLDKTPANALVLPFLEKLYPNAKYIVLTRHPAAIFASYSNSFFDGDYDAAIKFNPILSRYIPVMARFLRESPCPKIHVSYEDIAKDPESVLSKISNFLEIPFEPDAVNYSQKDVVQGLGDPIGVQKHKRPVSSSIHKWAKELACEPEKFAVVAKQIAGCTDEDLSTWGYPKENLWDEIEKVDVAAHKKRKKEWNQYALTRRVLVSLRKDIHKKPLGRVLERARFYCDVLLRGN